MYLLLHDMQSLQDLHNLDNTYCFLQKQQKTDKRVMLAEHQLQDLQQQLTDSQKLHKQLLQSLQLQQQRVEADREGAKAAQSAAEASRVEADEQARMADDVIKQLRQQLQEQAASHDAQVHALKVMLTCLECLQKQNCFTGSALGLQITKRTISQLTAKQKMHGAAQNNTLKAEHKSLC